jgi:hypothetical protein
MTYAPARKKRRWVGPVVFVAIFVILIGAAFFMAEKLARDAAAGAIKGPVQQALGSAQKVDVDLGEGFFLLQALSGSLDRVTVHATDVDLTLATADVELVAEGVPLNLEGSVARLGAVLTLDAAGVQALLPPAGDSPPTASFAGDRLELTTQTDLGGQVVPVVVSLTPSVVEGTLVFDAVGMTVNGEEVSVDDVRAGAYGPAAAALLAAPSVCVAKFLPAALILSDAEIANDVLTLTLAGTKVPITGGGFSSRGVCPE